MSQSYTKTSSIIVSAGDNLTTSTYNPLFTKTFPMPYFPSKNDRIALKSLALYYSWFNITSAYGNNKLTYVLPYSVGGAYDAERVNVVTLPDGFYTFSQIDAYVKFQMALKGHYLVNNTNNKVYYASLA